MRMTYHTPTNLNNHPPPASNRGHYENDMIEIDKERVHKLIKFRVLAQELIDKGYSVNIKNFYPDRITKSQQEIVGLLEVKIQEFLNELDKKDPLPGK